MLKVKKISGFIMILGFLLIFTTPAGAILQSKISASDGSAFNKFGYAVSISGNYAAVGAWGDTSNKGAVYVYLKSGDTWSQQAKLTAGKSGDFFGTVVAINTDFIIAGAKNDTNGTGVAYIFERSGTAWSQIAKLSASDAVEGDYFGSSVSMAGNYAIVGAGGVDDSGSYSGAAYIFYYNGSTWSQQAKLTPNDGDRADYFGRSVSISGDYAAVGAQLEDDNGNFSGAVYIFNRSGVSWSQQVKLTAGTAGDLFGLSVRLDDDNIIIGASGDDTNGVDAGAAYMFHRSGSTWSQVDKLTAVDGVAGQYFGASVSLSSDYAVVGAAYDDVNGKESSGSGYVYQLGAGNWYYHSKIKADDGTDFAQFGLSLDFDSASDTVIAGAHLADDDSKGPGSSGAIYLNGPVINLAVIGAFRAFDNQGVVVEWETVSEVGTLGFYLLRQDDTSAYVKLHQNLLPGLIGLPGGGVYQYRDHSAEPGKTYKYKILEIENSGEKQIHGPFEVTVGHSGVLLADTGADFNRKAHEISEMEKIRQDSARQDRYQAAQNQKTARAARAGSSQTRASIKLYVKKDGLYFLTDTQLASFFNISTKRVKKKIIKGKFSLTCQDYKIAYLPADDWSGLYFYGQANTSIYSADNVYWLEMKRGLKMETLTPFVPEADTDLFYKRQVHLEENQYPATALFLDPHKDFWLWDYLVAGAPGMDQKTFSIKSTGISEDSNAVLKIMLQGSSDTDVKPDHHAVVSINDFEIGEGYLEGNQAQTLSFSFPTEYLNDGDNSIKVKAKLDTGALYSIFYVDAFDLTYQSYFKAEQDGLVFKGEADKIVNISGFSSDDIRVFDISDPWVPVLINTVVQPGDGDYIVTMMPTSSKNKYLAIAGSAVLSVTTTRIDVPSDLISFSNQADYLVITPTELLTAAEELCNYRQTQGLKTMVVDLEDIMDQFNDGLYSPLAIDDFLVYATQNWNQGPRFVVLAGDGSYDYRNYMGHDDNLVPPMMTLTPYGIFATDNRYADISGDDGIPELAIGRIPVLSGAELRAYLDKVIAYESAAGFWKKQVMLLADKPEAGGAYGADSDFLAELLPDDFTAEKIYLSASNFNAARQQVLDGINTGTAFINYMGHSGLDRLNQDGLLTTSDVAALNNAEQPMVLTAMSCIVGRFALPGNVTLTEALTVKSQGGAVAAWAATGMSIHSGSKKLINAFYQDIFQNKVPTIGDAVINAKNIYTGALTETFMLDIYNLLGDPALHLK